MSRLLSAVATGIVAVLAVTLAVLWPGYEEQSTPIETGSVWALQTGDGTRYARVNTALGEIDTVRSVTNPSQLVQTSDRVLVYTQGNATYADVNLALPQNITDPELDALQRTPQGTVSVHPAGSTVLYLTDTGEVFAGSLGDPSSSPVPLSTAAGSATGITALAATEVGLAALYSRERGTVTVVAIDDGRTLSEDELTGPAESDSVQLTLLGETWYLLDTATGELYSPDALEGVTLGVGSTARIQAPATFGDTVHVADLSGLFTYRNGDDAVAQLLEGAEVAGAPATPLATADAVYAAWLGEGSSAGVLWSSTADARPLSYAGADIGDAPQPVFQASGGEVILNDTASGWVWRVPNGDLVASSQSWLSAETQSQAEELNEEQADQVIEPKPPVAVNDAFGVRVNSQLALQVMLNDSDPNQDVLSIVPDSVTPLDAQFGSLALGENNQTIVVTVAPSAAGTAQFSYRVTDGTRADGLTSNLATVTLTVVPDSINRAPVWCGVEGCLAEWPQPEVVPGGTVSTRVLGGWVDPDGDPVFVSNAVNQSSTGTVTYLASGAVLYQHPDPNFSGELSVPIEVTVSDDRLETATKPLNIRVTSNPNLVAESFAVSGVSSQPLTVDVLAHVTGTSGTAQLTTVETLDAQQTRAVINASAATFEFTANEPGSYLVRYTVRDALAERTGLVRILMQSAEQATFTVNPLTAFVWPQGDATLDVLAGVSNPTGRVLLVTDAQPVPLPSGSLSVDVLDQQFLRVSGALDSGGAGLIGTVRVEVADSATPQRATALVTVIAMPPPEPASPIAVDDQLTVRAGAQVDIPVLENDAPPAGGTLTLDPTSVSSSDDQALAFASGRVLRVLAPEQPGTVQVSYSVYTTGFPQLADTAVVTLTVLGDEANRKPQPRPLSARVLSGETVRIPFTPLGIDPDGDAVVLDQIVSQPERGTATISADGTALEYTSDIGFSGQVRFEYQVRDARGDTGRATVTVGVRDAVADPRPIVFTDTVQVQVGEANTVVVEPLVNDRDPNSSPLTLVDVVPNVPAGSEQFEALADRIVSQNNASVVIRAGPVLGATSYAYTVENADGDSAIGLIVVNVIRQPVADAPIISDTVLDLETREQFPRGVDVVTGKVRWATGSVSALTLSLWGTQSGVSVNGNRISGPLPQSTRIIPFQLAGAGFDGAETSSYGFLRVPGEDDLRLALKSTVANLEVNEGESLTFDMSRLVAAPAGAELEILDSGVRSSGVRSGSTCAVTSGTSIRYTSGSGAPWRDSCTVPVRLSTQSTYTYLTVPLRIIADVPQPELRPAAVTVSPGETLQFDLTKMVTWTGGENWAALQLQVDQGGDDFTTQLDGTTLTIRGADRVKPGVQQTATVSVTSYTDITPAPLTIRAGPAPSTLPQGATVTQQCSQADGDSCDIRVVGQPGEVNPLPGTPLELVSVDNPAMCPTVSFSVAGSNTIRASWTEATVGAACTATFIVKDAQDRQSLGDRVGTVTLDLQGYPQAPSSVRLASFGDRTVTLAVDPGAAANAYPAISGFVILRDGAEVATCGPGGRDCTPIMGLSNGEPVTFEARSVSSIGQSRLNNPSITTWSYRVPTLDNVTATARYVAGQTSATQGVAEVVITTSDPEVRAFRVSGVSGEVARTGNRTVLSVTSPVNTATLTVTPLSQFDTPNGAAGTGTATTIGLQLAGTPIVGSIAQASVTSTSITSTTLSVDSNGSTRETEIIYLAYAAGGSAQCSIASTGGGLTATVTNGVQSNTPTLSGLQSNIRYTVKACASNGFGLAESNTFSAIPFAAPAAPTGYTYSISDGSTTGAYLATVNDGDPAPTGFRTVISGLDRFGAPLQPTVAYCLTEQPSMCSESAAIAPTDPDSTVQFRVTQSQPAQCSVGSALTVFLDANSVTGQLATVETRADATTWVALDAVTEPIPAGTLEVRASYEWISPGTTQLQPYRLSCTP